MKLKNPPIIEAVVDLDCDMPPGFDLVAVEKPTRAALEPKYPKFRALFLEHHRIQSKGGAPSTHSANRAIQALQFLHDDGKQLIQLRAQGYSFNRLAPYTSLDDYLPEIERTWRLLVALISPVQVRVVRLRFINRIPLPLVEQGVSLDDYVRMGPEPADQRLTLTGFLSQYSAVEIESGHEINVVMSSLPRENETAPIIFDNCAASVVKADPQDWPWILAKIQVLRILKNRIFEKTLTGKCLSLFQQ